MQEMFEQGYHKIFERGGLDFEALALDIFRYQRKNNAVYGAYVEAQPRNHCLTALISFF